MVPGDHHPSDADVELRIEHERRPLDCPTDAPRFSWHVDTRERGSKQTAYRVLVARSAEAIQTGRGELWDSGRVESETSTGIVYDGPPLRGDTTYHWTVHLWDGDGDRIGAEPPAFTTALVTGSD